MIVVKVELHSAVTYKVTELARMYISNIGGTAAKGDYSVDTLRGRSIADFEKAVRQRHGKVINYPRLSLHVWNLVARALSAVKYG